MQSSHQQTGGRRKPTKLYVIGNGFDLWHGIPSGYWDFKEYVRQHDPEVFEAVEDYLPAGDDWSSLEEALADIDVENIMADLGQFCLLTPMTAGATRDITTFNTSSGRLLDGFQPESRYCLVSG